MQILLIIESIIPVVFLIALGYVLKKLNVVQFVIINGIKKLTLNIFLPALIFIAYMEMDLNLEYLLVSAALLLTCIIPLITGKAIGKVFNLESQYFPLLLACSEIGLLGYGLITAVYGGEGLSAYVFVTTAVVFFVNTVVISLLVKIRDNKKSVRDTIKSLIKVPFIWSVILGLAIGNIEVGKLFIDSNIGKVFTNILQQASLPAITLICIILGYELNIKVNNLLKPAATIIIRLIILVSAGIFIIFAMNRWMNTGRILQAAILTYCIMPPPFIYPLFMRDDDIKNKEYVLDTISLHIPVSLILFITVVTLLER